MPTGLLQAAISAEYAYCRRLKPLKARLRLRTDGLGPARGLRRTLAEQPSQAGKVGGEAGELLGIVQQ